MCYAILIFDILSVVNVSRSHGCGRETINDVGGNWSTQREAACRSERPPYPTLRYSESKSSFFNRFGMYSKFKISRLLQNVKTIFLSESNFI